MLVRSQRLIDQKQFLNESFHIFFPTFDFVFGCVSAVSVDLLSENKKTDEKTTHETNKSK